VKAADLDEARVRELVTAALLDFMRLRPPFRMRPRTGSPWGPCEGAGMPLMPHGLRGRDQDDYAAGSWADKAGILVKCVAEGGGIDLAFGLPPFDLFGIHVPPADEERAAARFRGAVSIPDIRGGRLYIFTGATPDGAPEPRGKPYARPVPFSELLPGGSMHGLESWDVLDPGFYPELDRILCRGGAGDLEAYRGTEGREPPLFVRGKEAARLLAISYRSFRSWSGRKGFPPLYRFSKQAVAFKRQELIDWSETMKIDS
jgi:hypothetical protein